MSRKYNCWYGRPNKLPENWHTRIDPLCAAYRVGWKRISIPPHNRATMGLVPFQSR
jgi:hypothetical protein